MQDYRGKKQGLEASTHPPSLLSYRKQKEEVALALHCVTQIDNNLTINRLSPFDTVLVGIVTVATTAPPSLNTHPHRMHTERLVLSLSH